VAGGIPYLGGRLRSPPGSPQLAGGHLTWLAHHEAFPYLPNGTWVGAQVVSGGRRVDNLAALELTLRCRLPVSLVFGDQMEQDARIPGFRHLAKSKILLVHTPAGGGRNWLGPSAMTCMHCASQYETDAGGVGLWPVPVW
jgi:hypothetical protein